MKKKIKSFCINFWKAYWRPEMLILPGQLAFFFFLSVVPTITLIGYGASFLNLSIGFINEFLTKSFGKEISNLLLPILNGSEINMSFFISLAIGYFFASNGASSIIVTSNTIYNIPDKGFLKRRIKALVMTFFIVLLFLFLLFVPLFGDKIIEMIKYVNLNPTVTRNLELIFIVLRGPLSWLIIFIFIKILYTMAPDKNIPSKNVNYGATFTTIGWIIATSIYSYYIANYAHYNYFYGGLANIVILMLWVYLLAYILVIGMALNVQTEEERLAKTTKIKLSSLDQNNNGNDEDVSKN